VLSEKLYKIFSDNIRPDSWRSFEEELNVARNKGYKIPDLDYSKMIITKEQAITALDKLEISSESLFYKVMVEVRDFPMGQGDELHALQHIFDCSNDSFWESEYPGISKKFLELSSAEGEGSYFYDKTTDEVINVDWNDMEELNLGNAKPTWKTYGEFLDWYYSNM
jgi:hypothetical protein